MKYLIESTKYFVMSQLSRDASFFLRAPPLAKKLICTQTLRDLKWQNKILSVTLCFVALLLLFTVHRMMPLTWLARNLLVIPWGGKFWEGACKSQLVKIFPREILKNFGKKILKRHSLLTKKNLVYYLGLSTIKGQKPLKTHFTPKMTFCWTARQPYRLSYILGIKMGFFYLPKDHFLKFWWKNVQNWWIWKIEFFWNNKIPIFKIQKNQNFLSHSCSNVS